MIDFAGEAKKCLGSLALQPREIDAGLKHIEVPGGTIDLEVYRADKLEKVVFCSINMHETGVVEATAMAWPDDDHNVPILWCNLTVVPSVMNVPIFDFVPMMDIVVFPDYAATYTAPLSDLRAQALETLGDTVLDKATNLPSLSVYALSPYRLISMLSDEGVDRVPDVLAAYIGTYLNLIEQAGPVTDASALSYFRTRKVATRALMKANDPGYPFMVDVFGEETTHAVFDIVF